MNNHHVYEEIGRGAHGVVYKGRVKASLQYVAVKCVDKQHMDRVLRDVRVLHAVRHPHVMRFVNWYETANHIWLVLELLSGGDLGALLAADQQRLAPAAVRDIALDVACGLQYLHAQGVVVGSLGPRGVLFTAGGRAKIARFPLAARVDDDSRAPLREALFALQRGPVRTARGPSAAHYTAPELFSGGSLSFASDLWSFGCLLHHMATGRPPWTAASFPDLVAALSSHDAPIPALSDPDVDAPLRDLLHGLLHRDPARRRGWRWVRRHPFWGHERISDVPLPLQQHLADAAARNDDGGGGGGGGGGGERAPAIDTPRVPSDLDDAAADRDGKARPVSAPVKRAAADDDDDAADAPPSPQRRTAAAAAQRPAHAPAAARPATAAPPSPHTSAASPSSSTTTNEAAEQHQQQPSQRSPGRTSPSSAARPLQLTDAVLFDADDVAIRPIVPYRRPAAVPGCSQQGRAAAVAAAVDVDAAASAGSGAASVGSAAAAARERLSDEYDPRALPFAPMTPRELLQQSQRDVEAYLTEVYRATASRSTALEVKVSVLVFFRTLCCDTRLANIVVNSSLFALFVRLLRSKSTVLRLEAALLVGLLARYATFIGPDVFSAAGAWTAFTELLRDRRAEVKRWAMASLGELVFYVAATAASSSPAAAEAASSEDRQRDVLAKPPSSAAALSSSMTQQQQPDLAVPGSVFAVTGRLLASGTARDEHQLLPAVRMIENVAAAGAAEYAARFAGTDAVIALVHVFNSAQHAPLRLACAGALSRLARRFPRVAVNLVERIGVKLTVSCLGDDNGRVVAAFMNVVNVALLHAPVRVQNDLASAADTVGNVMRVIDSPQPRGLKAKALFAVAILCRNGATAVAAGTPGSNAALGAVVRCCGLKLVPIIDRFTMRTSSSSSSLAAADGGGSGGGGGGDDDALPSPDARFHDAVVLVVEALVGVAPVVVAAVTTAVEHVVGRRNPPPARVKHLRHRLELLPLVLHLVVSPLFRQRVVTQPFLEALAVWLGAAEPSVGVVGGAEAFKRPTLLICEAVAQNGAALFEHRRTVIAHVLPALCGVYRAAEDLDTRFVAIKVFSDVLMFYLNHPEVYDTGVPADAPEAARLLTTEIHEVVVRHLLGVVGALLDDQDPVPLYALKLLNVVVETTPAFVSILQRLRLVPRFLAFFQFNHRHNNIHNLRLIGRIVTSPDVPLHELYQMGLMETLVVNLRYAFSNAVTPFYQPLLEIAHAVLHAAATVGGGGGGGGGGGDDDDDDDGGDERAWYVRHNEPLLLETDVLLALLQEWDAGDAAVPELSARCIALLAHSYGATCNAHVFADDAAARLVELWTLRLPQTAAAAGAGDALRGVQRLVLDTACALAELDPPTRRAVRSEERFAELRAAALAVAAAARDDDGDDGGLAQRARDVFGGGET